MNPERHKSKRLVLFNHKGGVGKTTVTVNLAIALGELGKRVLLVDSDPQCNLTSYLFEDSVVDDLLDHSDGPDGRTVWSAVLPIVEGTGDVGAVSPFELPHDNTWLVPGDIRLSEFEAELTDLWSQCLQRKTRGFRGTSAVSRLVNTIAADLQADYVLYDAGPNIGPLNRIILLDCDGFIVNMACDLFSIRALSTLGRSVAQWIHEWQVVAQLAPTEMQIFPGVPRLLGYLLQGYRIYDGEIASKYRRFVPRIEEAIQKDVIKALGKVDTATVPDQESWQIGQIKDFGSLVTAGQHEGEALWSVHAGTMEQRTQARRAFRQLADAVVRRTE